MILTPPEEDSLGKMYGWATKALGFKRVRHEGKVTGLAAMGEPTQAAELMARYRVDDEGRIHSDLSGDRAIYAFMRALKRNSAERLRSYCPEGARRCHVAIPSAAACEKSRTTSGAVGRFLAEAFDVEEVYIFPAMGDDGLPVGGALAWLMQRDGPAYWLEQRRDLGDVIWDEIFLPQPMLKLAAHRASGAFRSRRLMAPRGA